MKNRNSMVPIKGEKILQQQMSSEGEISSSEEDSGDMEIEKSSPGVIPKKSVPIISGNQAAATKKVYGTNFLKNFYSGITNKSAEEWGAYLLQRMLNATRTFKERSKSFIQNQKRDILDIELYKLHMDSTHLFTAVITYREKDDLLQRTSQVKFGSRKNKDSYPLFSKSDERDKQNERLRTVRHKPPVVDVFNKKFWEFFILLSNESPEKKLKIIKELLRIKPKDSKI